MANDLNPTARGYDPWACISAWQKAVRRGQVDNALYWAFELVQSGYGNWLWKRCRVACVEDCSPEATGLVADVFALNEQWKAAQKGRSDGHEILFVARAVISLATAKKSRLVDWAVLHHLTDHVERREIPDEALDSHTRRGRQMGRGDQHFLDVSSRLDAWTGSFDALESEYRDRVQARVSAEAGEAVDLPDNPWSPVNRKPAHIAQPAHSGQVQGTLRLETDR